MKISVVGAAGYVGTNAAVMLAVRGLADEIVLIDPYKPNLVIHLGMDTTTAVSEKGVLVHDGEYADMKGSEIVIVAAGAAQGLIASRMEMLPKNLPIIKEIAENIQKFTPDAVVITATNPVDPLNYAMYRLTGFDRHKVIGYTTNDSTRFRMLVAAALGEKAGDIEGHVLGEHGESQVLIFSSVKVKGQPVEISEAVKQQVRGEIPNILRRYEELQTGRTAGVTSGYGLAKFVNAIVNDTGEVFASSAVMDGEYGLEGLSLGTPLRFGRGGIREIIQLKLTPEEQAGLDNTVKVLRQAVDIVNNFLKGN